MKREAKIIRKTRETNIEIQLNLDGHGKYEISTGMGFFDHMLESLTKHAHFDMKLKAKGDLHVDFHHTVEDVGLVLGEAIQKALGKKEGIERFGFSYVPMDEALARVVLDLSGRPYLVYRVKTDMTKIRDFDLTLVHEFFKALSQTGFMTLHIISEVGQNPHHIYEAVFKAFARALKMACTKGKAKSIPSTKGVL
ncbi:MAG: imidazoleglycerol-phosphate dehydratase HisB [Chlamydiae bacterium]|nr:imidazoleglycerol-phosphate dehydratase HisB [Chlamydiota bacterium]MBI3277531.1 imidazoleglycerol-phosphate dehydratase HisB [Chlamydiota bacterium]